MDRYGLIGYPLGHSFSISYFNQKFADEKINAKYENYEISDIDQLPEILDKFPDLRGLNVTIPYKEKVIPFLDSLSPEARAIGAVNVIRVKHEGNNTILKGYNSDVEVAGHRNRLRQPLRAARHHPIRQDHAGGGEGVQRHRELYALRYVSPYGRVSAAAL